MSGHGHAHHEHEHAGKACTHEHDSHGDKPKVEHEHGHGTGHGHKEEHGHGHKEEHSHTAHAHTGPVGPIKASALEAKLRASALAPTHVSVVDESDGCGSKFSSVVVSQSFDGMALIDRHRAVQDLLAEEIGQIHAFQIKAWTPEQYEKKKAAGAVG